jgi:hypothetical protein
VLRLDDLARLVEDGEVRQSEQVHLQHADLLDHAKRPLGDHTLLAPPRFATCLLERDVLLQRIAGDDHPGRVRGGVARDSLQRLGKVQQVPYPRVRLGHRLESLP